MFTTDTPVIDLFRVDDTCDRCGAQAKVLALLNGGGELVFCGHHARKHRAALEPIAFFVEHSSSVH